MAGELAAEWIRIPDGDGNLRKVWIRDSQARRDIAQLQTDVSGKADAATTLAGYGITDAYTKAQVDGMIPSVPSAYMSNPEMDGTASPGSSPAWARGDHVHPSDTTKQDALSQAQLDAANSGATASKVTAWDKYQIFYGKCSTAAATGAKVVDCPGFALVEGARIGVYFVYAQTYNASAASPLTLNVNNTGAIPVMRNDANIVARYYWMSGAFVEFVYNGTNFVMLNGWLATTSYYGMAKLTSALDSTSANLALTAAAGKSLQDQINALEQRVTALGG